ncbi:hypothetical protein AG4045_020531 [Apium graveolens]|uniref:Glutaminase n=1 Tax=Apium graveolens TaxID=4045 RepID=A0A6L5BAN8_APIGR|nr:hypothetical protein AG4045_020531 [Apium graveolens]
MFPMGQFPALREFVKMGKPVWGTCAGLIFLADRATGQKIGGQELIGGLDCTIQSFEADLLVPEIVLKEGGSPSFRGVFIRAPAILEVGPEVEKKDGLLTKATIDGLLELQNMQEDVESPKKAIVAVKQRNILATAFHPELTADTRWHSYFLKMTPEVDNEASSSIIIPYGGQRSYEQPKIDLPVYQ